MAANTTGGSGSGGFPRSVADATRFTPNTPHANMKNGSSAPAAAPPKPAAQRSRPVAPRRAGPPGGMPGRTSPETLDERVRRLRAAHEAARLQSVSKMDRVLGASRKFFDSAHRLAVMGLIGFSGLAFLVTCYATADMMIYNRKRRQEFFAMQRQLEADSLEAARLAYMKGTATDEQVVLVEEAIEKERQHGAHLPHLLSDPRPAAPAGGWTAAPGEAMQETSLSAAGEAPKQKSWGEWLFSSSNKEDEAARRLSFGEEEAAASGRSSASQGLKDKAKAAFEAEKENQRKGGPLDQIGLQNTSGETKKKGWW